MVTVFSIYSYLPTFPWLNVYSNTYPKEVKRHFSFLLIDYLLKEEDSSFRTFPLPLNAGLPHSLVLCSLTTDLGVL